VAAPAQAQLLFRKEGGSFSMQMPPWSVETTEDRRAVVEIGGNINGLPLPEEGDYEFVLLWDGMEIARRRLRASKIDIEQSPPYEG